MKLFYHKISPILMGVGFGALAVGVFLSMTYYNMQAAYALVAIGFTLYVIGRIGIHFKPKAIKNEIDDDVKEDVKEEVEFDVKSEQSEN